MRLGFASIPLMYLTSTSTTKFLTLIRYALRERRAQNRPYSLSYESLNGNLRLVLSDHGFKQLSDPNTSVIYHGNLLFLTMGIMYLPCEQLLLTALVW